MARSVCPVRLPKTHPWRLKPTSINWELRPQSQLVIGLDLGKVAVGELIDRLEACKAESYCRSIGNCRSINGSK